MQRNSVLAYSRQKFWLGKAKTIIRLGIGTMLDNASQQRFARGCAEAAAGYATAATAAYTDLAAQALDFWCTALSGLTEPEAKRAVEPGAKSSPKADARPMIPAEREQEPPFGMALADWCPFPWLDPRRYEAMFQLDIQTPPALAMFALANTMPLRGSSKSWPFAQVMIESGVPRAVAWPAAEANAAALEAADEASNGLRQVIASYHTENGFATAVRSMTPSIAALAVVTSLSLDPLSLFAA